jgi:RND superfamily putative drug exporter
MGSDLGSVQRESAFGRLGTFCARHRWPVLLLYIAVLAVSGFLGLQSFGALKAQGFTDPASDAVATAEALEQRFDTRAPTVILAIESQGGVDDPATVTAATELLDSITDIPGVDTVTSYWGSGRPEGLRSADGSTGQVLITFTPEADQAEVSKEITDNFSGDQGALTVYAFGSGPIGNAFNDTITADLAKAESIAIPITLILLLFVFGSVVAAGLPFLVAGGAILGSFAVLWLLALVTDVSIFAVNLVTGLGLGLGIDYALLMINRFREELRKGSSVIDAVATMSSTAGKTVFVSGLTVAITLASLMFFPQYFLRSFAYAGVAVSLLAVVGALTALPAVLAILGRNVNRLKVLKGDLAPKDTGVWASIARFVMRYPWPIFLAASAVLLVMALPAFNATLGQIDERALPANNPAVVAAEVLRDRFPDQKAAPFDVVLLGPQDEVAVENYAKELSTLPEVTRVLTPNSVVVAGEVVAPNPITGMWESENALRLSVSSDVPAIDPRGEALLAAVRAVPAPADTALVGGLGAEWADATSAVFANVWKIAAWIAIATLIVLFLYTGSVLLPIKAVILNLLSLSATLGALVWVFQGQHLTWLTGDYVATGTIDITMVALIAVTAFALSMDYELFLLSRIKEEHDAGRGTTDAVAFGLQRTGRIITAAALLLAIVFASFLSSGVTSIKQLGFGVTVAILVDATIVRALLVPSFMRIAGSANWWAPAWLHRVHSRVGLSDG